MVRVPLVLTDPNGELHFDTLLDRGLLGLWGYSTTSSYDTDTGAFTYRQIVPMPADSAVVTLLGVADPDPTYTFADLTGGVLSEVWNLDIGDTALRTFVVDGTLTNGVLAEGQSYGFGNMDTRIDFWQVLSEDAATAEISRSQVWQWVVSPKGILDDGRKVTADMVRALIPEELAKVKTTVTAQGEDTATYDQAAGIFETMSLSPDYPEFLTLPLYEAMD